MLVYKYKVCSISCKLFVLRNTYPGQWFKPFSRRPQPDCR